MGGLSFLSGHYVFVLWLMKTTGFLLKTMYQNEFMELCKDVNFDSVFDEKTWETTEVPVSSKASSLHSGWMCLNGSTFYKHLTDPNEDITGYSQDIVTMCLQYDVHFFLVCRNGIELSYFRINVYQGGIQWESMPVMSNLCGILVSTNSELTKSFILEGILCPHKIDDIELDLE